MPWIPAQNELKEQWNRFIIEQNGSFLQSKEWSEFQAKFGRKIFPFVYKDNKEIKAEALIIRHSLPFGLSYFYCPRGPVIKSDISVEKTKLFEEFFETAKKLGKQEKAIFFKIEPEKNYACDLLNLAFKKSKKEIQPAQTIILDLQKDEQEILDGMKQKTRYNIRLAETKGVTVKNFSGGELTDEQFEKFWNLLGQTTQRENFRGHERNYYKELFKIQSSDFSSELFLAEHNGETIAAHFIVFFASQTVYLHGASSRTRKEFMAPHLLHWEAIKSAKKRGALNYDFWGISEQKWPNLTRFKKSFGGEEINYSGAFDFAFDKLLYFSYNIYNKVRKII